MENNAIQIANSPVMWAISAIVVVAVIGQCLLFIRLAMKVTKEKTVDLSKKQCIKGVRAGMISAIGPSLAVFVVMIGLIAVLGGPIVWLRLSVIGGSTTELTAATIGIKSAGGDITQAISLKAMSTAWWTMTVNACGWLLVTAIFAGKIEVLRNKIGSGDSRWLAIFSSAATLGIFGVFCSEYIIYGIKSEDYKTIAAVVVGGLGMWICLTLAKKYKWINEYALGFSMILGLSAALLI